MNEQSRVRRLAASARPHLIRLLCLAYILSFILPYVDVRGCTDKKLTTWPGYALVMEDAGWLYLPGIAVFAVILALSFRKGAGDSVSLRAFGAGWRALGAAFAGFMAAYLPALQFLFDTVIPRAGQAVSLAAAGAAFIGGIVSSARGYRALRLGRPPGPVKPGLVTGLHRAAILLSLALVPVYAISLRKDVPLAIVIFLIFSLPFVLVQCVAVEASVRGEGWARRWAAGVLVALAGAAALAILSFS